MCICWLIVEVILRNARSNDEIYSCVTREILPSGGRLDLSAMFLSVEWAQVL